jgi:predicted O-linked N-acetylglucosamine transferase (SPINDLY family)
MASHGEDESFDVLLAAARAARQSGDDAFALALFERALRLRKYDVACLCDYALALCETGQGERAAHMLNAALRAAPGDLNLMAALARALRATNRFQLAANLGLLSAQAAPDSAHIRYELGHAFLGLAEPAQAAAAFAQAADLASGAERDAVRKAQLLAMAYDDGSDPDKVLAVNRARAAALAPSRPPLPHDNAREPERRLRVGYVSSDFRYHSVARPLEALFAYRDRARFEAIAYSETRVEDSVTKRFRALADGWVPTRGMSDADVAQRMRADRIDVLVLSAAHFDENRLGIALHRPAPVQISIYDSGTTGTDAFDGIVLDPDMAGGGCDRLTERPLRTRAMFVHPHLAVAPDLLPPPCIANGFVTFGSANHPSKFSGRTFALWSAALRAVPGSQLRLKSGQRYDDPETVASFRARFADLGLAPERIVFERGNLGLVEHLRFYQRIDLSLDTAPFNGATTSFESLWMGVPIVALRGRTIMARWTAALLARIGAADWAADDEAGYADIAARLAAAAHRQDRPALRARVAASTICNLERHARDYERLYRALWRRWCAAQHA